MSWNQFQKEFANKGYNDSTKSSMYERLKNYVINPKESDEANKGKYPTFVEAMRARSKEPLPLLQNPKTERELYIKKLGMIINLSQERRRKEMQLRETSDLYLRELLQSDIEHLSRLIEKLKSVLPIPPIPPDPIAPEGLWQQFEHEMSVSSGKYLSKKKLSKIYKAIKEDVLSGKYPNFIEAMRAYELNLFRAKKSKSAEPAPLTIKQPVPIIQKPEPVTIFVPKTLQEIQAEAKKEVESRREEIASKIHAELYQKEAAILERRENAIMKFNKENELRKQIQEFLKIKKVLLLQGKLGEVADVDKQLEMLKKNLLALKDE